MEKILRIQNINIRKKKRDFERKKWIKRFNKYKIYYK